jgi:hypothetical protein
MGFLTFVFFWETGFWETDFSLPLPVSMQTGVLRPERSTRTSVVEFSSSLKSELQISESVDCTVAAILLLADLGDLKFNFQRFSKIFDHQRKAC